MFPRGAATAKRQNGRLAYGAEAFQYFPKNPRSLSVKPFDRARGEPMRGVLHEHGIVSIAHSALSDEYRLGGCRIIARERSLSLLNDLDIAEACGSLGVVVHFGVYKGPDPLEGYRNAVVTLSAVTRQWNGQGEAADRESSRRAYVHGHDDGRTGSNPQLMRGSG